MQTNALSNMLEIIVPRLFIFTVRSDDNSFVTSNVMDISEFIFH